MGPCGSQARWDVENLNCSLRNGYLTPSHIRNVAKAKHVAAPFGRPESTPPSVVLFSPASCGVAEHRSGCAPAISHRRGPGRARGPASPTSWDPRSRTKRGVQRKPPAVAQKQVPGAEPNTFGVRSPKPYVLAEGARIRLRICHRSPPVDNWWRRTFSPIFAEE